MNAKRSLQYAGPLALFWSAIYCTGLPDAASPVADAAARRDTICAFVMLWEKDLPELREPAALCRAEADLQQIAAAYAGCTK